MEQNKNAPRKALIMGVISIFILAIIFMFYIYFVMYISWIIIILPLVGMFFAIYALLFSIKHHEHSTAYAEGQINRFDYVANALTTILHLLAIYWPTDFLLVSVW